MPLPVLIALLFHHIIAAFHVWKPGNFGMAPIYVIYFYELKWSHNIQSQKMINILDLDYILINVDMLYKQPITSLNHLCNVHLMIIDYKI